MDVNSPIDFERVARTDPRCKTRRQEARTAGGRKMVGEKKEVRPDVNVSRLTYVGNIDDVIGERDRDAVKNCLVGVDGESGSHPDGKVGS